MGGRPEAARRCAAALKHLAKRNRDGAAEEFAAVLGDEDAGAYHGPAGFGLALARWSLLRNPHEEVYEPLCVAADSGHAVYAPAAQYLLALWHTGRGPAEKARELWTQIAAAGSRVYAPVAHYALGCSYARNDLLGTEGDDEAAAVAMHDAWVSNDAEYGPKALLWLCAHAVRTGQHERVQTWARIGLGMPYPRLGFEGAAFEDQKIVVWRHLLLNRSEPAAAFRIAETLARVDHIRDATLLDMIGEDVDDDIPASEDTEVPWFAARLDVKPDDLYILAAQLFATVDGMYLDAALPCLEGDPGPEGVLRTIIARVDQFPWGADLRANARIRLLKALDGPDDLIPEGWPHHESVST